MSVLAHNHNPLKVAQIDLLQVDNDFRKKFVCPEESSRFASSLEQLVFNKLRSASFDMTIIEFGSGTGSPVISAILNSGFLGTVHGYEINQEAAQTAHQLIEENGISRQYIVHNESFFEAKAIPKADLLIANPPYVPCDNKELLMLPDLYGGPEGIDISKGLLSSGYKNVFLEVSSYSNPVELVRYTQVMGYKISDFVITHLPFGMYSRQDIVQQRIHEMKLEGKAFFGKTGYLVGGAFFTKGNEPDLSDELLACLTSSKMDIT